MLSFTFRLHPAFEALISYYILFTQTISNVGVAIIWSLGFFTALVALVPFLVGSLIVVAYTLVLARLYLLPVLRRYTDKVCTRFGVRHRHRKTAPAALLTGLALGSLLTLGALTYFANEVVNLLDFIRFGRDDPIAYDYRSILCTENADMSPMRALKTVRVTGWSYTLWRHFNCDSRYTEIWSAIWDELEGITYDKACDGLRTWPERATCARHFILVSLVQRFKSYFSRLAHAMLPGYSVSMKILSSLTLPRALDVLTTLAGIVTILFAIWTYLRDPFVVTTGGKAIFGPTINATPCRVLPRIIVTAATPIFRSIGNSSLSGLFDVDAIPDMWWNDDPAFEDLEAIMADAEDTFDLGEPEGTSTPPPLFPKGFLAYLGLGKSEKQTPNFESPEMESPPMGMGMGMSSSFSSTCLSDLTKGATVEEKAVLARIENGDYNGEDSPPAPEDDNMGSSRLALLFFFALGLLLSIYGTALPFLAPVLPHLLASAFVTFPVATPAIFLPPQYPLAFATYNLRFDLISRVVLLCRFVLRGGAERFREAGGGWWRCWDVLGGVVEVDGGFEALERKTRDAFLMCDFVRRSADEYIETCDVDGVFARARCVGWSAVRDLSVMLIAKSQKANALIANRTYATFSSIAYIISTVSQAVWENKFGVVMIVVLACGAYIVSRLDEDAEIEHAREQHSLRRVEAQHQELVTESARLHARARKLSRKAAQYPTSSTSSPSVPVVPQQRDSSGIPSAGLGLGLTLQSGVARGKCKIGREFEGRAMLARLKMEEREKEACGSDESDSDEEVEEVVTPTDEKTMMPTGMKDCPTVVDERRVFSFVCPDERARNAF